MYIAKDIVHARSREYSLVSETTGEWTPVDWGMNPCGLVAQSETTGKWTPVDYNNYSGTVAISW